MHEMSEEMSKLLHKFQFIETLKCPTCKLLVDNEGDLLLCPKCSRKVCVHCVAIDKTDCMSCGL